MKEIKNLGQKFRNKNSKVKTRFALYLCKHCSKEFESAVSDMNTGRIISCGCKKKIKQLNNSINGFEVVKDLKIIDNHRMAIFRCKECNKNFTTRVTNIKTLKSNSCGCLPKHKTHGQSNTRLYRVYEGMKSRCYTRGRKDQKHYYDKKIEICNEWLNNNSSFFDWALSNGYKDNLTIERIDGNKNYTPENCKFENYHIQATNKPKIMSTNTSGYKGVTFVNKTGRYNSRICIHGKRKTLGTFNTALEASNAYDKFITENNLTEYITNKDLIR